MKSIKNFTLEELKRKMERMNEPSYRAAQVFLWLYKKDLRDFEEMNNVPAALRAGLKNRYSINALSLARRLKSADGTEKFLFKLNDGNFIESVLIYSGERGTVCLSSQVGCKYRCSFCASGLKGLVRNLETSEIIDQTMFLKFGLKRRITNFVFMGMGEPLDNYKNVAKAILIMTDPDGMNIAAKRITVSTCGIIPGIKALQTLKKGINLSVSLHAADDSLRSAVMPVNKKYPLKDIVEACRSFADTAKGDVTFEYVLIKGRNDSLDDAGRLAVLAKKAGAKINLLVYSPVPQLELKPSDEKTIKAFTELLEREKTKVTLRRSKGADIAAACGQLAGQFKNKRSNIKY